MRKRLAALLPAAALLAGCSAAGDVETLLRAPQLSGESAALQKALNSYLGGSATPIGASANVVGTSVAAKNGHPVTWGTYCKYCAPATVLVITIAMVCLFVRYL